MEKLLKKDLLGIKDLSIEETSELLMGKEAIKEIVGNNKIKKIITVPNKIFSIVI